MPKNVIITDAANLAAVPLPSHGSSYTVVSHKFIIDKAIAELQAAGFVIDKEEYCRNLNGEVALGVYHLQYGNDPDMGLMFTWANSYDKTMRFRCAIGGYTHISDARVIAGDMSNYGRVHTGDAKEQVEKHITSQIQSANSYFASLVNDKEAMKKITLTGTQAAELMGIAYFDDIITSSQLINIKDEINKPSFVYSTGPNNLWTIYNHFIVSLKKSHPKRWMEQQKELHKVVKNLYFAPVVPVVVDPAQTNLLDEIESLESTIVVQVADDEPTLNLDAYMGINDEEDVTLPIVEGESAALMHVAPKEEEEIDTDSLLHSDANCDSVQDPDALTLGAHTTKPEFPTPPANIPLYADDSDELNIDSSVKFDPELVDEVLDSSFTDVEDILPLEEQVAGEYIEPVSEAELEISAPPVVDEPKKVEPVTAVTEIADDSKKTMNSPFEF